jgi:fatty-acyl-CoA synthase
VQRTHAELHDRAARGVDAGDRVAMLLHNGLEFPETLLGCHRLGAIAVPINSA